MILITLLIHKLVNGVLKLVKLIVVLVQLEILNYKIFTSHKIHGVHSIVISLKLLRHICLIGI